MSPRASILALVLAVVAAGLWFALREEAVEVPDGERSKPRVSVGGEPEEPRNSPPQQQTLPARREVPPAEAASANDHAPSTTIRGRVVDADGRGIEGARVRAIFDGFDVPRHLEIPSAQSKADGSFTLVDCHAFGMPVRLIAHASGRDVTKTSLPVAWGTDSVVLVLREGASLRVAVRGRDGRPIETFALGAVLQHSDGLFESDVSPTHHGPHADGVCDLSGLARGTTTVAIAFPDELALAPFVTVVEVGALAHLDVRVEEPSPQRVRVVDEASQPIDGVEIAVTRTCEPVRSEFLGARNFASWISRAKGPLVVAESRTDHQGRCAPRVPAGFPVAVRARIEGFVLAAIEPVAVPTTDEILLRLSRGARLRGRLVPPDAATALREFAEGNGSSAARGVVVLQLLAPRGTNADPESFARTRIGVGRVGAFDRSGLVDGTFPVRLLVDNAASFECRLDVGSVVLRAGETTDFDVDVSTLRFARCRGSVRWNGGPLPEGLSLWWRGPNGSGVARSWTTESVAGDPPSTRFESELPAGRYQLFAPAKDAARSMRLADLVVEPGRDDEVRIDVRTGSLRLQLVDSGGGVVPGVDVFDDDGMRLGTTSVRGELGVSVVARTHSLRVLPASLRSNAARAALWRNADARREEHPFANHLVPLADVEVAAGGVTEVEVRLPRE